MTNKELAIHFFTLTFNDHEPRKAALLYLNENYIQHNPGVDSGRNAFIVFFEDFFKRFPKSFVTIKRVIADADYVVLHVLAKKNNEDAGEAVAEFFRIANGQIKEHWDVVSTIPSVSKNNNGVV